MPRKVSIITRTKDRPVLLARAVESVLAQTLGDWQHIIVNDGGDAAGLDRMLEGYSERYEGRLAVIHNPKSLGMQDASNKALELAEGEYIGVHDDDDAWHPDFLKECTAFLDERGPDSNYKGVISRVVRVWEDIDADGNVVEHSRDEYLPLNQISLFRVGFENPFPPIAFLYRRSVHAEIGGFDQQFDVAGDMDFNIRFLLRYEIGVIHRKLAYYHWRRSSPVGNLHNSVTAQAQDHGRRLNEWLNYYLRADADKRPENLGLALNLAHYVVGTKGKADEAAERIARAQTTLAAVQDILQSVAADTPQAISRLEDLKEHLTSVSTGLFADLQPRLADLKTHLAGVSAAIDAIGVSNADRFADFKEHLTSVSAGLFEDLKPRLDDLKIHLNHITSALDASGALDVDRFTDFKAHLTSITDSLDASGALDAGRFVDFKEHLTAISSALEASGALDAGRFSDFKAHLTSISDSLDASGALDAGRFVDFNEHLTAISSALEASGALDAGRFTDFKEHLASISSGLFEGIAPSVADLKAHLTSISDYVRFSIEQSEVSLKQTINDEQLAMGAKLAELMEEVRSLRKSNDEALRGIRIGPFRLSWRKRKKEDR